MTTRMSSVWTWGVLLAILGRVDAADALTATARQILDAAGVKGGLIVHLGCGDGKLTAALRASDSFLVHGLDPDAKNVETARAHIRSLGLYGKVSVDQLRGNHLPYADNLVNLLVCEYARERVSESEMTRVLAPGGVALSVNPKSKIPNPKSVKPRPEGVDEWTHFLHDASGNPVAHDRVVGPPRHLQWTSDPPYTRSHEHTPSVAAVVSTDGRLFYIADEAPVSSMLRSAQWHLVARDAYNGVLLWKRPIAQWWPHICGWTQGPRQLQRKLVAVGKRVYVTLGFHAPLSALDAATGETLRVYDQTHGTEEVVWHKGTLLLVVRSVTPERVAELDKWVQLSKEKKSPLHSRETIEPLLKQFRGIEGKAEMAVLALEADTGRMLWKKAGADVDGLRPVSLRAIGDRVLLQKAQNVVSLDLKTGKEQWTAACAAPLRVVGDRAVVCADGKTVAAFSTETGEALWTQKPLLSDVRDAFLIRGSLWLGGFKPYSTGRQKHTGPVWGPYFVTQHDLATGAVLKEINPENPSHHHRCYANKATDRYIVGGRRGTEFIDIQTGEVFWHSWARGVCQYGVMPCNGLLYCPPHACGCYVTTKLSGFNALAGQRSEVRGQTSETGRLERGPAFSGISKLKSQISETGDWATYRHDAARSGATRSAVPVKLKAAWQTALSGKLTPPTVAAGKVFVASVDEHRVCALDADSGKAGWDFTAGGRVDSPPTVFGERALFGCRDGHVYSVRASDGALAWRLRAARDERRVVVCGQVESASPVHGSVLVRDGVAYATAGRSSYLDSGIDLCRVQPETGKLLSRTTLYSPDPETGQQPKQYGPAAMPGARSDILVSDGEHVYLRDLVFGKDGVSQPAGKPHLLTLTDFLDDAWPHRSYWIFGTRCQAPTGCSGRDKDMVFGRLLAFDDTKVYGYGREKVDWSNQLQDGAYRLFAVSRTDGSKTWAKPVPIQVRAMVLAGEALFVAGPPAEVPDPTKGPDPSQGALLIALSASDGAELSRCQLDSAPVFDGMAAAHGRLYLTTTNGKVLCLAGDK